MGIRYYAYPVDPELVERAVEEPHLFLSDDPLADAWGADHSSRPEMLYLDKCWMHLQVLTGPRSGPPRMAFELFEGQVHPINYGYEWLPWTKVLPPDVVDAVARDLAMLDEDDVTSMLAQDNASGADPRETEYVVQHLRQAQEFTARMQRSGWGLVYMIG